jgi:peptidoglycan/xylan/chitin deacetylase (PgdA/CDA1 family)
VVLVAGGGLMLGIAAAVGWQPNGVLAGGARDHESSRARPPSAAPRSSPKAGKTAHVTRTEASPRPAEHQKRKPSTNATDHTGTAEPVYYLDDGPKTIALTIDDGPSPIYTPQILRILERYKVTASFSMVGESVTYNPGIARDVADAGHVIINHTWDHSDLALMTASQARTEIARATDAIHAAVGERPRIFRAPYGAWSRATLEYCAAEKLMPLDWSVDPRDWARPGVREIVSNIMANTATGSIILEHDGGGDRSETVAALKIVIPRLLDRGYRFRTP